MATSGNTPIRFASEPFTDDLVAEMFPLLLEHWREIAVYQDIPLEPDIAAYRANAEAGILRVFTARADLGEPADVIPLLVGYALFFVRPNPHYASSIQAAQDILFLHPSVRGGTGYRFIAWCDDQLRAEGVQAVYHHVKAAHDFGILLERQGYEMVDKIYAKRLDQPTVRDIVDRFRRLRPEAVDVGLGLAQLALARANENAYDGEDGG